MTVIGMHVPTRHLPAVVQTQPTISSSQRVAWHFTLTHQPYTKLYSAAAPFFFSLSLSILSFFLSFFFVVLLSVSLSGKKINKKEIIVVAERGGNHASASALDIGRL